MNTPVSLSFKELCDKLGAEPFQAPSEGCFTGVAPLEMAQPNQVSFLTNPRYGQEAKASQAGAIIVSKATPDISRPQLVAKNAYLAWAKTCELFAPDRTKHLPKIADDAAVISKTARIGNNCHIGPGVFIGDETVVGDGCIIHAGVVIEEKCTVGEGTEIHPNAVIHYQTQIGKRCVIWSGAVLGSYGFGYAQDGDKFIRIHQLGRVILEDEVELGSNTAIDRGAAGDTVIRRGTKLDNLIHIAHNVEIGEDTAIAAQTGISGSTKIGNRVKIAGQVGFVGHIEIGDDSFIGAQAGVSKSFPVKSNVTGYPARPFMEVRRSDAAITHLPELMKRVAQIEAKLGISETSSNS